MAAVWNDDEDMSDADVVNLIPRKANGWILATIGAELVRNTLRALEHAMDDVTTVLSQRYNWEQDRREMFEEVGREIETLELMKEADGANTD